LLNVVKLFKQFLETVNSFRLVYLASRSQKQPLATSSLRMHASNFATVKKNGARHYRVWCSELQPFCFKADSFHQHCRQKRGK